MPSPKVITAPAARACVHYAVSVLNPDGTTARALPRKRNLILDSGLDLAATQFWADLWQNAAVGTGTDPVRRDSGAVTLARAGTTVTASAGFFAIDDVGRLIKMDTGEEMYITAYTDTTHVTVSVSGTIAAGPGTVWYVNRSGLAAETKRTSTYGSNSGDNGSTYSLGAWVMQRTFIFSAESGGITYNEIGWSYTTGAGANLFGMDIITGGVSLTAGQQLKVIVEVTMTLGPAASTPWANVITGWSQDGDCCVESVSLSNGAAMSFVQTDGSSNRGYGNGGGLFDVSANKLLQLASDASALVAQTTADLSFTGAIGGTKVLVAAAYVTGTFTRTYTGKFAVSEGNSVSIRSLIFLMATTNRTFRVLLDAAETKDSDHTLEITFTLTWGRVLTN